MKIIHGIVSRIEALFAESWLNPFATIYLNLRCMRLRAALKFPIYVYGRPKFLSTAGLITINGKVTRGMIEINKRRLKRMASTSAPVEISLLGELQFSGRCFIFPGAVITVRRKGKVFLGEDVVICENTCICCLNRITIGSHVRIAHRCQVFDSSFHYMVDFNSRKIGRLTKPVSIGNYCWIGNSSTISAGAVLPNNTTVASNSLANKDYSDVPEMSIIGGMPCKLLKTGVKRVWCPEFDNSSQKWITKYFDENPQASYCGISEEMTPDYFDIK